MAIPDGLSFDELNKLYEAEHEDNLRSMPFEQYFGEMELSREQKDRRIETAREIQSFMRLAIMELYYELHEGEYGEYDPSNTIREGYSSLLNRLNIPLTAFFAAMHVESVASEIPLSTMMYPDDPYFFSKDRVALIAENEANSIWNDSEHQDAIMSGKTRKTWDAIIDKVTRDTHRDINGVTIPIDEPFQVGDSLMMYPKDESMGAGPEEIVNCRCSVSYS